MKSHANGKSELARLHYDRFYADNEWVVDPKKNGELITHVCTFANDGILDIGCGTGIQSEEFSKLGYNVTSVDISSVAIERAKRERPGPNYVAADLAEWEPTEFPSLIFCRGLSWFHYELDGVNRNGINVRAEFNRLCSWIMQGHFILQIATDFSGTDAPGGVRNNKLHEYINLFQYFMDIVEVVDWDLKPISENPAGGILITGRV